MLKETEIRITIQEMVSGEFYVKQTGRWLHFYRRTISCQGKERETLVGELHKDDLPQFIRWLRNRVPVD